MKLQVSLKKIKKNSFADSLLDIIQIDTISTRKHYVEICLR